jgi:DNA polymerase I-like protein with 3'-5' exonuclease and polymerase domains
MRLVVDLETTPIPDNKRELPDTIWCIVARDIDTNEEFYADGERDFPAMVVLLQRAELLVGHNIAKFDVPVIEKLFNRWKRTGRLYDTLVGAQMVYAANLYEYSIMLRNSARPKTDEARERRMPTKFLKAQSLEAWGYRLEMPKLHADVTVDFYRQYSDELLERCRSDVRLTAELFRHLTEKPAERGWPVMPLEPVLVDSEVAYILGQQERNGVAFDNAGAQVLLQKLQGRRAELTDELRAAFPAWYAPRSGQKDVHPEVPRRTGDAGYTAPKGFRNMKPTEERQWPSHEGGVHTKVALVEFNPGSRHHRAEALKRKYGWRPGPDGYGADGVPTVDEETLAPLDYPEIPALLDYMTVAKRIGQLAEGKEAWTNHGKTGRIHGKVNVVGTRTSRMSHVKPNLGQVPKKKSPYGAECRALFGPTRPGWVMVGADASGLELRMLAHRMAYFDDGAFAKILLEGDPHETWRQATGLFLRENQKTFTYADLYGAGDEKRGQIVLDDWREAFGKGLIAEKPPRKEFAVELGKQAKAKLLRNVPALEILGEKVREAHKRGYLRGLDGRIIAVKTEHGALNDLLQSDGAIVMKHALLGLRDRLAADGQLIFGRDFAWMLNVHDEWQIECLPQQAEIIGMNAVGAIAEAGEKLGVRCPLDGEYKIGNNWLETH